ncbi:MAG: hypothetical protein DHS20C06_11870 [Hyphobacterium sp.]|nr:MAG: hypothetical protein DHS20C06_11870 [Hyphobacterium sp.]
MGAALRGGEPGIPLFSYGTLQQENVQLSTFNRLLSGQKDALVGFRLQPLEVTDPAVIAASGTAMHTIAVASPDRSDQIDGTLFLITTDELVHADRYEVDPVRIETVLKSGRTAYVYVAPNLQDDE